MHAVLTVLIPRSVGISMIVGVTTQVTIPQRAELPLDQWTGASDSEVESGNLLKPVTSSKYVQLCNQWTSAILHS